MRALVMNYLSCYGALEIVCVLLLLLTTTTTTTRTCAAVDGHTDTEWMCRHQLMTATTRHTTSRVMTTSCHLRIQLYITYTSTYTTMYGTAEPITYCTVIHYSDANKTTMFRTTPVKQQQDYITEKLFCCNTHVCYQKITWCKNIQKVMSSNVWHCFCSYRTQEHRCLLHFSIIMSHSTCRAQQCWKQDQKYKTKTKTKTKAARPSP